MHSESHLNLGHHFFTKTQIAENSLKVFNLSIKGNESKKSGKIV